MFKECLSEAESDWFRNELTKARGKLDIKAEKPTSIIIFTVSNTFDARLQLGKSTVSVMNTLSLDDFI